MKNQLIATLVVGLILFIWQFLSWAALNIHRAEMQYTENQDAILANLAENLKPGTYFLPQAAPGEDQQAAMARYEGKPYAAIHYRPSMNTGMGMQLVRGFAVDLVSAFLLVWLLLNFRDLSLKKVLLAAWAVGGIAYLTIPYLNSIWYETNTFGHIVDWIVQWGLIGVWLGWWLTRK